MLLYYTTNRRKKQGCPAAQIYTAGLLDKPEKLCYNVGNKGEISPHNERVKTMNTTLNNAAVSAVLYAYQQYRFFLQQEEESFVVLRTEKPAACSAIVQSVLH